MGGERWPSPSWWTNYWFHWSILFLFFFSLCFWCCFSLLGVCQYIPLVLQASLMKIIIQKKRREKDYRSLQHFKSNCAFVWAPLRSVTDASNLHLLPVADLMTSLSVWLHSQNCGRLNTFYFSWNFLSHTWPSELDSLSSIILPFHFSTN